MDPIRHEKAKHLRSLKCLPYAAKFERTHTLAEGKTFPDGKPLTVAGRVVLFRSMGKLTFATLQDHSGRLQIAFREEAVGAEEYKLLLKMIDLGDFIGISGERFTTQKGEPTVLVKTWTMLSKALRQPPEKWHGIADRETAYRQRYLDTMSSRESFDRFLLRSAFLRALREFYWSKGFVEVEIPVLVNAASGALATPFATHHAALDLDVYLRIALETHQKECLVGGFDRTFALGPVFRNEGMDPSHLQEFTMCEHYASYWDYRENMRFTEEMLRTLLKTIRGTTKANIPDRDGKLVEVDFAGEWPKISMREIIKRDCGIDFEQCPTADDLRKAIKDKKIALDVDVAALGRGNLIDQLYKKVSRPKIVAPTFITQHPIDLSPLARRNDENPNVTDRFQLVVGGWEIVNAYSELIDPVDQAERFGAQAEAKEAGDSDAHGKDDEFVTALEYGCPPCSGWGMGIDRIIALLTAQENLKDVVLFPLMKPEERNPKKPKSPRSPTNNRLSSVSSDSSVPSVSSLPDERSHRFVAILNEKIEHGKLMNALGHMTAGLSNLASQSTDLCFLEYKDKDNGTHPGISHFPFIVLKAENGNQIRKVRTEAQKRGIPSTDFTSTMTVGTSQAQQDATKSSAEAELEYYGICMFGKTDELKELTKKFSLFR
ncbi:MAG: lysine--tRNA ligase [Candidatus Peribacteraceae bacterium]|nr:lysine--tRNA ligase [Candidatus Peribacteraceae bacterium]